MLNVNSISFGYTEKVVLKDLNFTVGKGEHLSIIGESGCGKSTLLKIVYGLLQPHTGAISWNDKQVLGPDFNLVPGEKYMKYLSQDFDLMPYTTVEENVSKYLSVFYPEELKERTDQLLEMIEMEEFAKTKIKSLSGGQQQRVALARVLAQEPEVLLLDEPFSHIDHFRTNSFRKNLFTYLKRKGITCLVATHDMEDVLPYADQLIVLKDQEILAHDTPKNIYRQPKNIYTASLFGEVNIVPIQLLKQYAKINKSILIYPHEFQISDKSGLRVRVKKSFFKGSHYLLEGLTDDGEVLSFTSKESLKAETKVYLNVALETINARIA
ncbi:ABC transporter ATP-binding protein [Sediminicola arcticus]|jgi:iron(III) transport system ATP-binding protein|uniref:ABC transporter ATP-binding protein n=1 Tax=Sediminicola arcticus TaxID=1574308 RepID=A0ABV2SQJ8_9FLAO